MVYIICVSFFVFLRKTFWRHQTQTDRFEHNATRAQFEKVLHFAKTHQQNVMSCNVNLKVNQHEHCNRNVMYV